MIYGEKGLTWAVCKLLHTVYTPASLGILEWRVSPIELSESYVVRRPSFACSLSFM